MLKALLKILCLPALLLAPLAGAHHSAAQFDLSIRDLWIEGEVVEFTAANPHTRIILKITDEKGTRDVEFEGHSRNNYYRSGYRPDMVHVGDRIKLNYGPMRDGSDGGYVLGVETAKGERF